MGKIYINQSKIKFTVDLKTNITGSTVKLKYIKPDGTTGEVDAIIDDAPNGIISYIPPNPGSPLDQNGTWKMWAFVTYGDAREAPGEPFEFKLNIEGK